MATPHSTEPLLTAEDLYALPEEDQRCELVEGRLVVSEPPGWGHGAIAARITVVLDGFVTPRRLGQVAVESGHVLARRPDTVRADEFNISWHPTIRALWSLRGRYNQRAGGVRSILGAHPA